MTIEQTAFRAGLVAPQRVLADARRRLGASIEQYPGATRSVAFCGREVEELMLGGLIGEPQLWQERRVGSRRRRCGRSLGGCGDVRVFGVQANVECQSFCQSDRHLAESSKSGLMTPGGIGVVR